MPEHQNTDERIGKALAIAQERAPVAISRSEGGLLITNADQAKAVASAMSASTIAVPAFLRGNVGACLAVVIQAVEWRMNPWAVASKAYSVNDRLGWESQLVQAVILQRAPIKGRMRFRYEGEGQDRRCFARAYLTDAEAVEPGDFVEVETPRLRDIKPQNSPLWKNDPDQQLSYYSGRVLCRRYFPDVLLGVYTEDEIDRDEAPRRGVSPPRGAPHASISSRLDALAAPQAEPAGRVIEHLDEPKNRQAIDVMEQAGALSPREASDAKVESMLRETAATDPGADRDHGPAEEADGAVDESEPDDSDFPGDAMTPKEQRRSEVLAALRSAATDGNKALDAAAGKLSEPDLALVTEEEQRSIRAIAEEVDQRSAKRGGRK